MGIFSANKPAQEQGSQRQQLAVKFGQSRHNILLVVIFTAINIFLLVTNSNSYFLWSAYVPYILADLGMLLCGYYPPEVYGGDTTEMAFLGTGFFVVMMVIIAVILVLYLLSWIFSKKERNGWLIFALVFFSLDTVIMLLMRELSSDVIIDVAFHAWVIVSLSKGVSAGAKLKKLPPETEEIIAVATEPVSEELQAEVVSEELPAEE